MYFCNQNEWWTLWYLLPTIFNTINHLQGYQFFITTKPRCPEIDLVSCSLLDKFNLCRVWHKKLKNKASSFSAKRSEPPFRGQVQDIENDLFRMFSKKSKFYHFLLWCPIFDFFLNEEVWIKLYEYLHLKIKTEPEWYTF